MRGTKGGLRRAPRVIAHRTKRGPRVVQGRAHAAQRIAQFPAPHPAAHGRQAGLTIQIRGRGHALGDMQHLAQRRGQILGQLAGDPILGIRHQHAITLLRRCALLAARRDRDRATQRVIGRRRHAIAHHIAGGVEGYPHIPALAGPAQVIYAVDSVGAAVVVEISSSQIGHGNVDHNRRQPRKAEESSRRLFLHNHTPIRHAPQYLQCQHTHCLWQRRCA